MSKSGWKKIFKDQVTLRRELDNVIKKKGVKLKFGRSYLIVSDIASQFFSEASLELDYIFGRIRTEEQEIGSKLHEKMAEDAVLVTLEEQLEAISQEEEIAAIESSFFMKFDGNYIVGKPDIVMFKRGIPIILFEYKFSKYSMPFEHQRVQAQVYCQMLKEVGYKTDLLGYGIILAPRNMTKESEAVKAIPWKVSKAISPDSFIKQKEIKFQFDEISVFLYKFDPEEARKSLEWAIEYWEGKREVSLSKIMSECKKRKDNQRCRITYEIVQDLLNKFSSNVISIHGIGSFFDRKLPEDWIKNDIDILCIVEDIEKIPRFQDWTKVRKLDYKKDQYQASVFFNSLEALKKEEVHEKESWANYKWALLELKIPDNSVILYGKNLRESIPDLDSIEYDHEDLLRHALYHVDNSFKLTEDDARMMAFTKGVFKFGFLICVYFDDFYSTSINDIYIKINQLVDEGRLDISFLEAFKASMAYRRGIPFSDKLIPLQAKFTSSCFDLLREGMLWKKYSWQEIIDFCHETYKGLSKLENLARIESGS